MIISCRMYTAVKLLMCNSNSNSNSSSIILSKRCRSTLDIATFWLRVKEHRWKIRLLTIVLLRSQLPWLLAVGPKLTVVENIDSTGVDRTCREGRQLLETIYRPSTEFRPKLFGGLFISVKNSMDSDFWLSALAEKSNMKYECNM